MTKQTLRKNLLSQRRQLSVSEVSCMSKKIAKNFINNINVCEKIIHIYTNCKDGEVDTFFLQSHLKKASLVLTSHTHFHNKTLTHYNIVNGKYYEGHIDIIIVPGIAFNTSGHRIGYGYGFYDRFLDKHKESILVGFAYDFQLQKNISNNEHDIPVHFICTENKYIKI